MSEAQLATPFQLDPRAVVGELPGRKIADLTLSIGPHAIIRSFSVIYAGSRIGAHLEEDDVFLAPGVMIANDRHPICRDCMRGPTIKRAARVGINATLLPEIVVGEAALVGAGAVVTRDVPPRAVVVGNPARVIGTVDQLTHSRSYLERTG